MARAHDRNMYYVLCSAGFNALRIMVIVKFIVSVMHCRRTLSSLAATYLNRTESLSYRHGIGAGPGKPGATSKMPTLMPATRLGPQEVRPAWHAAMDIISMLATCN